jgi:hypothetical protein
VEQSFAGHVRNQSEPVTEVPHNMMETDKSAWTDTDRLL